MKPRAVFVCSSHFHVEMFSALRATSEGSFDLTAVVDDAIRAPESIDGRLVSASAFSLSGAARLTRAGHRARAAAEILRATGAQLLVVGNDMAPLERALARAARRAGRPVVLLQDGLFPAWGRPGWRVGAARLAVGIGAGDLAPTVYGAGEATHVGALGEAWSRPLQERTRARVAVVGNVAFTTVLRDARSRSEAEWLAHLGLADRPLATFFTTNVLRGLGRPDPARHQRQLANVRAMRDVSEQLGWQFAVRPHPAEHESDYGELSAPTLFLSRDVPLAGVLGASRAGFVAGTVVSLLLSRLGRATIWPIAVEPSPDERAAAGWLGIPMPEDASEALRAGARIDDARAKTLLGDDATLDGASARLVARALDLK